MIGQVYTSSLQMKNRQNSKWEINEYFYFPLAGWTQRSACWPFSLQLFQPIFLFNVHVDTQISFSVINNVALISFSKKKKVRNLFTHQQKRERRVKNIQIILPCIVYRRPLTYETQCLRDAESVWRIYYINTIHTNQIVLRLKFAPKHSNAACAWKGKKSKYYKGCSCSNKDKH